MKYFTKEELEDITKELIKNPTRETLKKLNEKYNGSDEEEKTLIQITPDKIVEVPITEPLPTPVVEEQPVVTMPNEVVENQNVPLMSVDTPIVTPVPSVEATTVNPVVAPSPSFNTPNMELPKVETAPNDTENVVQAPSFELPKLETPTFNNQNNEQVNFSGNLWETPKQEMTNLMQTTDNFNVAQNIAPSTEVSVSPAPFFISSPESVNNPIPVGGPLNNMPTNEPTMFGQLEQNYM